MTLGIILQRDITKELLAWKDNARRKPLLVTGVRQCGKTYIIKQFAKEQFQKSVYVNFEETPGMSAIFDYDFDVKRIEVAAVQDEILQEFVEETL